MLSAPTIMVSSTFFDLRQIRTDLTQFISSDLGYIPLLSELSSFPINPDLSTIENCRARVEQNADVLVLIIGGRYGSIDDKTGKSITNLEYLSAKQKNIPIYVFIDKNVLTILPIWEQNPSTDFSSVVDTPALFEFVRDIRGPERAWTFPFESAQDIISTLRLQFAYLFSTVIRTRLQLIGGGLPSYFSGLSPKALRLALEKPRAWEHRLFLQSLADEVKARTNAIRDFRARLAFDVAEYVAPMNATTWLNTRMHELQGFVASSNSLISDHAADSFGPPGIPGDAEKIIWVAQNLGRTLDAMLAWSARVRSALLAEPFEVIGAELARFTEEVIDQFEMFPSKSLHLLESALEEPEQTETRILRMTMVFTLANLDGFEAALSAAKNRI